MIAAASGAACAGRIAPSIMGDLPRREREAFSFGERAAMELLVKKVLGSDLAKHFPSLILENPKRRVSVA